MNFEEALQKVREGTATPEERAFVEARVAHADAAINGKPKLDFDEALTHVLDGNATDEEKEYVNAQLKEASALLGKSKPASQPEEEQHVEAVAEARPVLKAEQVKPCMDFEEALEHVQNGTATQQEMLYVKSQTAAANVLFENNSRVKSAPFKEASGADVKKAKRSFVKRYVLIPLCVLLIIVVALGAILGGVFGFAASSAKKNMKFDKSRCREMAIEYVLDPANSAKLNNMPVGVFTRENVHVDEVDRHFHYNERRLGASYYSYEISIEGTAFVSGAAHNKVEIDVELLINTVTGTIDILDVDID